MPVEIPSRGGTILTTKTLRALAPLPDTALRLLSLIDNPDVSLRELGEVATRDVGISTTMLRMANSSMFGLRGRVGNIGDALRVIGTAQARLLVLASGVSHASQQSMPVYSLAAGAFHKHSELVANLSLSVACDLRYTNIGNAYTAGLLHDMGKILLNALAGQSPAGTVAPFAEQMAEQQCTLRAAESARFGADHTQVAYQLAQMWSLPPELAQAIVGHHDPLPPLQEAPLMWCVAIANSIAGEVAADYPVHHRAESLELPEGIEREALLAAAQKLARA